MSAEENVDYIPSTKDEEKSVWISGSHVAREQGCWVNVSGLRTEMKENVIMSRIQIRRGTWCGRKAEVCYDFGYDSVDMEEKASVVLPLLYPYLKWGPITYRTLPEHVM